MRFEHRDAETGASIADRVWRTRSDDPGSMTSAARTSCQLILTRTRGQLFASVRGPETTATVAPVPPDAEFVGIRFALGAVLRPYPAASLVDGYAALPVTDSNRILLGGEEWEAPTYENAEHFLRRLERAGLLMGFSLPGAGRPAEDRSARTVQRRYRAITGLSRTAVAQIDRANAAATMLREGVDWRVTVARLGYFDQAHLAHALRRYVGYTALELRTDDAVAVSFLYKTGPEPGS